MLRILVIIIALGFSGYANAATAFGTLGVIPQLTVGGITMTDLANLIVLHSAGGANTNCTPRKAFATSGYVVPALKTFYIWAVRVSNSAAAASHEIGYADNDVGLCTGTAFTNPKGITGAAALTNVPENRLFLTKSGNNDTYTDIGMGGNGAGGAGIPTGKYPGYYCDSGGGTNCKVVIYGYEQ